MSDSPSTPLEAAAVGVRFLLELGALAAVGYWGAGTYPGIVGFAVGAGAALALATAWGVFVSPKAPWRLPDPWRLAAELLAFALATVALAVSGLALAAAGYAVLAVADEALLIARDLR